MFLEDSSRGNKELVWIKYMGRKQMFYLLVAWLMTQHAYHITAVSHVAKGDNNNNNKKNMNKKTRWALLDSAFGCCKKEFPWSSGAA